MIASLARNLAATKRDLIMQAKEFIVWDLGATKCAFAIVDYLPPNFQIRRQYQCFLRDYISLENLVSDVENKLDISHAQADAICIAGAGQYNGHELILDKGGKPGYPYPMKFATIASKLNWQNLFVVHDYTPMVCRTFLDNEEDIQVLHAGESKPYGRRVALGVGTGLGMKDAVLLPNGQIWIGTNEIGHIGLSSPPISNQIEFQQHLKLLNFIHDYHHHHNLLTTFETILSGPGFALLHQFVTGSSKLLSPEDADEASKQETNSPTLQLFAKYLGLFIGVVQLTFMPQGGIWISGGVLQKNLCLFSEPLLTQLYQGIECSPSYQPERQQFPLKVMLGENHAFWGGAFFLVQQLQQRSRGQV